MNARGERGKMMVTPGNREGERERQRGGERRENILLREKREEDFRRRCTECVFALAVRSIAKIAPNLAKPAQSLGRSERGREKRREEGCGEK